MTGELSGKTKGPVIGSRPLCHVWGPIFELIARCDEVAGLSDDDHDIRFRGELTYHNRPEKMMHAYIWFNQNEMFPGIERILLHETPIYRGMMPTGQRRTSYS